MYMCICAFKCSFSHEPVLNSTKLNKLRQGRTKKPLPLPPAPLPDSCPVSARDGALAPLAPLGPGAGGRGNEQDDRRGLIIGVILIFLLLFVVGFGVHRFVLSLGSVDGAVHFQGGGGLKE